MAGFAGMLGGAASQIFGMGIIMGGTNLLSPMLTKVSSEFSTLQKRAKAGDAAVASASRAMKRDLALMGVGVGLTMLSRKLAEGSRVYGKLSKDIQAAGYSSEETTTLLRDLSGVAAAPAVMATWEDLAKNVYTLASAGAKAKDVPGVLREIAFAAEATPGTEFADVKRATERAMVAYKTAFIEPIKATRELSNWLALGGQRFNTVVGTIAQGFDVAAPVMSKANQSMADTILMLAALNEQGMSGEQSGYAVNYFVQEILAAEQKMGELGKKDKYFKGFSFFEMKDGRKVMRPFVESMKELRDLMKLKPGESMSKDQQAFLTYIGLAGRSGRTAQIMLESIEKLEDTKRLYKEDTAEALANLRVKDGLGKAEKDLADAKQAAVIAWGKGGIPVMKAETKLLTAITTKVAELGESMPAALAGVHAGGRVLMGFFALSATYRMLKWMAIPAMFKEIGLGMFALKYYWITAGLPALQGLVAWMTTAAIAAGPWILLAAAIAGVGYAIYRLWKAIRSGDPAELSALVPYAPGPQGASAELHRQQQLAAMSPADREKYGSGILLPEADAQERRRKEQELAWRIKHPTGAAGMPAVNFGESRIAIGASPTVPVPTGGPSAGPVQIEAPMTVNIYQQPGQAPQAIVDEMERRQNKRQFDALAKSFHADRTKAAQGARP